MTARGAPSLLFVCLGNICRSPLAEAVMRSAAQRRGFDVEVDSAGTGDWHIGKAPDSRAIATAARHGLDIGGLRARQVTLGDFSRFDRIVALDRANLEDLRRLKPSAAPARLSLLLDHAPGREGQDVVDPYFGSDEGFELAWIDIVSGVEGLIGELRRQASL